VPMYQTILGTVKVSLEGSNEQIWDGRNDHQRLAMPELVTINSLTI